jgi:hypothetical protein
VGAQLACDLFKSELEYDKIFTLASGMRTRLWPKVVDLKAAEAARKDQLIQKKKTKLVPLANSSFAVELDRRAFSNPNDVAALRVQYHDIVEDGYNGLTALSYGTMGWSDAEARALGRMLQQVTCPLCTSLDLSNNNLTDEGLIEISEAFSMGSLHALTKVDLSDNVALTSLPDTFASLQLVVELKLDGCFHLSHLPDLSPMASLKVLSVRNCLRLPSDFTSRWPSKHFEIQM